MRLGFAALAALVAVSCQPQRPDIVALTPGVPAVVHLDEVFEVETGFCNAGAVGSPAGLILLGLRAAGLPGTSVVVAERALPELAPGECSGETTPVVAPGWLREGAYEIVALHRPSGDPDAASADNFAVSALIGIGTGPDLAVGTISEPAAVLRGETFEVAVEVCNRGNAPSTATQVGVYLAAGTDPEPQARWLAGALDAPDLPLGVCETVEGLVEAGVPGDGAYYLAAEVDEADVVDELIESNNAATGAPMGVGTGPDLVVGKLSTLRREYRGLPGFDLHGEVCNRGTTSSTPTTISFFAGPHRFVEYFYFDPFAGLQVPSLGPGDCYAIDTWLRMLTLDRGAFPLRAVVDEIDAVLELVESNNTATGPLVGLGTASDLVVRAISGPGSTLPNQQFDVSVLLCNDGPEWTDPYGFRLRLYLSADLELDRGEEPPEDPEGEDPRLREIQLDGWFVGSQCRREIVSVFVRNPPPGPYYFVGLIDPWDDERELVESNNVLFGSMIGVGEGADLVVESIEAPPSIERFVPFDASVQVCNRGTGASGDTRVAVYLSADARIEGGAAPPWRADASAGEINLPALAAGACMTLDESLETDVAEPGPYRLGAIVDEGDTVSELIETNNAFSGGVVGVGSGPDLVVTRIEGPPSAFAGDAILLDFEVCNDGTAPSTSAEIGFYDSHDTRIEGEAADPPPFPGDRPLGEASLPALAPGDCHAGAAELTLPSEAVPGPRFLGAVVDEPDAIAELRERNNAFAGELIGIGDGPDLVVDALLTVISAPPGDPVPVLLRVCNQGTAGAGGSVVSLHQSFDERLDAHGIGVSGDWVLGQVWLDYLEPGECQTGSANVLPGYTSSFDWYLGAVADSRDYEDELIETNNARLRGPIEILD